MDFAPGRLRPERQIHHIERLQEPFKFTHQPCDRLRCHFHRRLTCLHCIAKNCFLRSDRVLFRDDIVEECLRMRNRDVQVDVRSSRISREEHDQLLQLELHVAVGARNFERTDKAQFIPCRRIAGSEPWLHHVARQRQERDGTERGVRQRRLTRLQFSTRRVQRAFSGYDVPLPRRERRGIILFEPDRCTVGRCATNRFGQRIEGTSCGFDFFLLHIFSLFRSFDFHRRWF